jgi:hypothetical protein
MLTGIRLQVHLGEIKMSENPTLKSNTTVTEASASWNTKYNSPEGFICQITLRADSGKELLEKAQAAITHLLQTGCIPCDSMVFRPSNNGHDNEAPHNGNGHPDNGNGDNHTCPIHGVAMRRWEKDGRVEYSFKVGIFSTYHKVLPWQVCSYHIFSAYTRIGLCHSQWWNSF